VVDLPFKAPYCRLSILPCKSSRIHCPMKDSNTLDRVGVKEIRLLLSHRSSHLGLYQVTSNVSLPSLTHKCTASRYRNTCLCNILTALSLLIPYLGSPHTAKAFFRFHTVNMFAQHCAEVHISWRPFVQHIFLVFYSVGLLVV